MYLLKNGKFPMIGIENQNKCLYVYLFYLNLYKPSFGKYLKNT